MVDSKENYEFDLGVKRLRKKKTAFMWYLDTSVWSPKLKIYDIRLVEYDEGNHICKLFYFFQDALQRRWHVGKHGKQHVLWVHVLISASLNWN